MRLGQFPPEGAERFAFPPPKVGSPEINALSQPVFRHSCWVTKPSERVSKTWSYTSCYSEITLKHPVWYGQVTDIFATQTARSIDLIYKWSPSILFIRLTTMTNILKHPLTSTCASNSVRLTARVNSCELMFLFFKIFVTPFDIVERLLVNGSEHDAF